MAARKKAAATKARRKKSAGKKAPASKRPAPRKEKRGLEASRVHPALVAAVASDE